MSICSILMVYPPTPASGPLGFMALMEQGVSSPLFRNLGELGVELPECLSSMVVADSS
jgi:hypothetical protein